MYCERVMLPAVQKSFRFRAVNGFAKILRDGYSHQPAPPIAMSQKPESYSKDRGNRPRPDGRSTRGVDAHPKQSGVCQLIQQWPKNLYFHRTTNTRNKPAEGISVGLCPQMPAGAGCRD